MATRTTKHGSGFALGLYLFPLIAEGKSITQADIKEYTKEIFNSVISGLEKKSDEEIDQLYKEMIKENKEIS